MSRHTKQIGTLIFHYGVDHAIGSFLDIRETRFEGTPQDHQGEGYIFEYSTKFGIGTNLAKLTYEEAKSLFFNHNQKAKEKIDYFIKNLKQKKLYHVHHHWEYSMKRIATFDTLEEAKQKKRELDARHPNPFAKFIIRIETLNPNSNEKTN